MVNYLEDEELFKADAYMALCDRFPRKEEFETYYATLSDDNAKAAFLRASTSYLFFVKNGDWVVRVPRSNEVIDYFTNSYKLVGTLAIIESLTNERFVDFYEWLRQRDDFPIESSAGLDPLYRSYKRKHGSMESCRRFFRLLPDDLTRRLRSAIEIEGEPAPTIEKVVELLYRIRSQFAHESENSLQISNGSVFDKVGSKKLHWRLPMSLLLEAFEVGLLTHFNPDFSGTA